MDGWMGGGRDSLLTGNGIVSVWIITGRGRCLVQEATAVVLCIPWHSINLLSWTTFKSNLILSPSCLERRIRSCAWTSTNVSFSFSFSFHHCWDKLPFESATRTSNYSPEGCPWFKPIIGLCGGNSEVDSFPYIQRLEFSVEFGSAMMQVRCRSLDWGPAVLLRFSMRPELGLSFFKSISNDFLQHSQYCFKCY